MLNVKVLLFLGILVLIVTGISECRSGFNHGTNLKYHENERVYALTASYDPARTWEVESYINRCTAPTRLFHSDHDHIDAMTQLDDHTRFNISAEPGELQIELNKEKNSRASYFRIRGMCEGIKKDVLLR